MEITSKTLGVLGEELACHYIRRCGYKLLMRNYRCPLGEIDLIAREKKTLVFLEVKTRKSLEMGLPVESVTPHKRHQIIRCAKYYLNQYRLHDTPCRFDVVSVILNKDRDPEIYLIADAFGENP